MYSSCIQIAPALATGNTIVAKPSEMTSVTGICLSENLTHFLPLFSFLPLFEFLSPSDARNELLIPVTAYMLCKIFDEVKLPPGVCNFVFGLGPAVGTAIVSHPRVPLISFTGGTVTGRRHVCVSQLKLLGALTR